jgi:hypothetical protein
MNRPYLARLFDFHMDRVTAEDLVKQLLQAQRAAEGARGAASEGLRGAEMDDTTTTAPIVGAPPAKAKQ